MHVALASGQNGCISVKGSLHTCILTELAPSRRVTQTFHHVAEFLRASLERHCLALSFQKCRRSAEWKTTAHPAWRCCYCCCCCCCCCFQDRKICWLPSTNDGGLCVDTECERGSTGDNNAGPARERGKWQRTRFAQSAKGDPDRCPGTCTIKQCLMKK